MKSRALSLAVCGALAVPLAVLAVTAARHGVSDFWVQSARQEIDLWQQPNRPRRSDDAARVMAYLDRSRELTPQSAWTLEELGVMQLRNVRTATRADLALASARGAYIHFRQAMKERPTSPFVWSNLAVAKLYLSELDAELFEALERAMALGPREPQAQQSVAFVGMSAWHVANEAQRALITDALRRFGAAEPDKSISLARAFSRLELLCEQPAPASKLEAACSAARKKSR